MFVSIVKGHNGSKKREERERDGHQDWREKKIDFFLLVSHTEERSGAFGYWNQKGSLWTGVCVWGWMGGWLVSWLVDRSERANAAPCESSLYLDDKEPNLTQWNGRMVMETAFNLHRRSLFVDSRWKSECSSFVRALSLPSSRALFRIPPHRDEKGIVLYLSSVLDRIFYSDYTSCPRASPKWWISLWLPIAAHCDDAKTDDDASSVRRIRRTSEAL